MRFRDGGCCFFGSDHRCSRSTEISETTNKTRKIMNKILAKLAAVPGHLQSQGRQQSARPPRKRLPSEALVWSFVQRLSRASKRFASMKQLTRS